MGSKVISLARAGMVDRRATITATLLVSRLRPLLAMTVATGVANAATTREIARTTTHRRK
jgi:hypothetical protein